MKKVPLPIIGIIVIIVGGLFITLGYSIVFDQFNVPYNENLAKNRFKRFTDPLSWLEDRFSGITSSP